MLKFNIHSHFPSTHLHLSSSKNRQLIIPIRTTHNLLINHHKYPLTTSHLLNHLQTRYASTSSQLNHKNTSTTLSSNLSTKSNPSSPSISHLKRLLSLAKPESKNLSISAGLLLISSSISLSMPFLWGKVIDIFTQPELLNNFSLSLPTVVGCLTGAFLLGSGANTLRIILIHITGQRIINRLRTAAFTSVMKADISWHDLRTATTTPTTTTTLTKPSINDRNHSLGSGSGDLVSRLGNDSHIVGDAITRDLSDGTRSLATVLAGVSMMFIISSKLTFVMLTVVPPTAIGAFFFGQYLKKLSHQTQLGLGQITNLAEEKITHLRTVHTFNNVPQEIRHFDQKAKHIFELAKKEAYARGLFFGGSGFTGNATIIALLTYGGTLVSRGEISVGDLSSLMMYTAYVGSSLMSLSSWFATFMKGLGASSRIFELIDAKPVSVVLGQGQILNRAEPLKPVVFKNVHFSYPTRPNAPILKGLNLTITPGSSLAIAGSSGSGKSTLAYLLLRFYDPQSGGIIYGDDRISSFTPESWRSNIGVVPQDPGLFTGTVAENIGYGIETRVSQTMMEEAARLANAIEFIKQLPNGFDTEIGPKGIQLSGGQRQRLAIARALVRNPQLLILDEATSALDTGAENEVNFAIQSVMNERSLTTVIIAHRLSTLKTADQIIYIEDGKVLESGTYEELSKEGTGFNVMIKSQLLMAGAPVSKEIKQKYIKAETSDSIGNLN